MYRGLWMLSWLLCTAISAVGANYQGDYKWAEKPDLSAYNLDSIEEPELGLIRDIRSEMVYGDEGELEEFYYVRYMVFVNSEEAIERNNKIYIGVSDESALLDYNARVINRDGSVKELGKEALLEGVDEDEAKYKYFAVSGAEIGSIIEYYYLLQRSPRFYGHYINFQRSIPILRSTFELRCPDALKFAFQSVNGLPEITQDTSAQDCNRWTLAVNNVPKEYDEYFANNGGNEMLLLYHLHENVNAGVSNILNYNKVTSSIYATYLEKQPKRVIKHIKKILKEVDLETAENDRDKILRIEHYVKTNFRIVDVSNPALSQLDLTMDNHLLNERGVTLLFYHLFKQAGIPFELVITSNRYQLRFHKTFEDYSFLEKYLLYFPGVNEYMSPSTAFDRLGTIPQGFIWTYGLFITEIELGDKVIPVSEVRFIEAPEDEHTLSTMDIRPVFAEDFSHTTVHLDQKLTGYYALNTQVLIGLLEDERDQQIREGLVNHIYVDSEIKELKIENGGAEFAGRAPLLVSSVVESTDFLDKAGNRILFKVGDLIGPQAEMYQEQERQLDVENDYNRAYYRTITFDIPSGYKCDNLEGLKFDVKAMLNDSISCAFVSDYEVKDRQVVCKIHEYYRDIHLPKSSYEAYRNVINAAADFNKVVLVFQPE